MGAAVIGKDLDMTAVDKGLGLHGELCGHGEGCAHFWKELGVASSTGLRGSKRIAAQQRREVGRREFNGARCQDVSGKWRAALDSTNGYWQGLKIQGAPHDAWPTMPLHQVQGDSSCHDAT